MFRRKKKQLGRKVPSNNMILKKMIIMKFKCKKLKNYIFKFCNTNWYYTLNKF